MRVFFFYLCLPPYCEFSRVCIVVVWSLPCVALFIVFLSRRLRAPHTTEYRRRLGEPYFPSSRVSPFNRFSYNLCTKIACNYLRSVRVPFSSWKNPPPPPRPLLARLLLLHGNNTTSPHPYICSHMFTYTSARHTQASVAAVYVCVCVIWIVYVHALV